MTIDSWLDDCVVRYAGAGMESAKSGGMCAILGCAPLPEIRWRRGRWRGDLEDRRIWSEG